MILLVGLRSLLALEVRQYPETRDTVVTVTTAYPGANSELVKGFITTPLQQAIAEADGIDYLFARSTQGNSTIEAHMELNYDPNGDRIWSDSLTVMREQGTVSEGMGFSSDLDFRRLQVGPGSIRGTGGRSPS